MSRAKKDKAAKDKMWDELNGTHELKTELPNILHTILMFQYKATGDKAKLKAANEIIERRNESGRRRKKRMRGSKNKVSENDKTGRHLLLARIAQIKGIEI